MKYVFMNHRIREKKPSGPVVVVQDAEGNTVEANTFAIRVGGVLIGYVVFDPKGLDECKTHDVKAWVELNDAVVLTPASSEAIYNYAEPKPVASEKKPNSKVSTK